MRRVVAAGQLRRYAASAPAAADPALYPAALVVLYRPTAAALEVAAPSRVPLLARLFGGRCSAAAAVAR